MSCGSNERHTPDVANPAEDLIYTFLVMGSESNLPPFYIQLFIVLSSAVLGQVGEVVFDIFYYGFAVMMFYRLGFRFVGSIIVDDYGIILTGAVIIDYNGFRRGRRRRIVDYYSLLRRAWGIDDNRRLCHHGGCLIYDNCIRSACQKIDSAVDKVNNVSCQTDSVGFFMMIVRFGMRSGKNACCGESDCCDSGDFNDVFHNTFLSFCGYYENFILFAKSFSFLIVKTLN